VSKTAQAPSRQLARIKNGQAVGAIYLPNNHRLLVDPRPVDASDKVLAAYINEKGAFCWCTDIYASALSTWLHKADGDIESARTRSECDGWPSYYLEVSL